MNATDINQASGTVSLDEGYIDNMNQEWNINIGAAKTVKLAYNIDTEDGCDYVDIYNVDDAGSQTLLLSVSGSRSGTIYTTSKSGKVKIIFTSDGSVNYQDGYTGFDIQFAVDDRSEVNGLIVTGDSYVSGNSFTAGKLGLGTTDPQATLDTRGNAYISGLTAIGTVPFSGNKFYVYNSTENAALRASTSRITTSSVYGICSSGYNYSSGTTYGLYSTAYSVSGSAYGLYSSVSGGSSSKKWAGYFTGGTVEVNDGKLHLNGSAATVLTTNAGMITFWDDARFTVTNSTIPSLRTSSYSMTNYGVAAVPVTGGADLWLSGYSGIRMFTGAVAVPRFNITNDGNVGIGTTSPETKLHVEGGAKVNGTASIKEINFLADGGWGGDNSDPYTLRKVHESGDVSHLDLNLNDNTDESFRIYGNSNLYHSFDAGGNAYHAGNVGIGTSNPQYKLDVKGQIRATEVLVQSVDQFADFVFDKGYRLPSLHEVNTFIQDNGHLPGIPSAQEVKENGMSLVEMQVKLLQKVEELTLYSIKQQEEIKALKDELDKLKRGKASSSDSGIQ